jgi:hypothetical protein
MALPQQKPAPTEQSNDQILFLEQRKRKEKRREKERKKTVNAQSCSNHPAPTACRSSGASV